MPDLDDFIDKVVGGEAGAAREQLQSMIGAKTADALDVRKQQISSALFNNGEEQEIEEPETEVEETPDATDTEEPTMTGSKGRTHGARTVSTPATNESINKIMYQLKH